MGVLWRLFAPRPLKKARHAMYPSWVLEDAIVRSARKGTRRRPTGHEGRVYDPDTGREWRCPHAHRTQEAAQRCANTMDRRIGRLGWEQATRGLR
jgi:hypothetical protein